MDRPLLNKLKFHLAKLLEAPSDDDWVRIVAALDALAAAPAAARTAAVRKRIARCEAMLRERRLPGDSELLLRELTQATQREVSNAAEGPSVEERVAAGLRGRALVVVGGEPRPESAERLREVFGLSELLWPVTRESTPDVHALEPLVARADVAAVVLLIRWIRHALNEVSALCARHEKPLARVTTGYNPAQIAKALHEQCGRRLGL